LEEEEELRTWRTREREPFTVEDKVLTRNESCSLSQKAETGLESNGDFAKY
jgi:hypothetical protein